MAPDWFTWFNNLVFLLCWCVFKYNVLPKYIVRSVLIMSESKRRRNLPNYSATAQPQFFGNCMEHRMLI